MRPEEILAMIEELRRKLMTLQQQQGQIQQGGQQIQGPAPSLQNLASSRHTVGNQGVLPNFDFQPGAQRQVQSPLQFLIGNSQRNRVRNITGIGMGKGK